MSTIPEGIPYDIWRVASAVHENAKQPGPAVNSFAIDERTLAVEVSLLLIAERLAAEQRGAEREREACAMVATGYSEIWKRGFPQDHPEARSGAGREIAAAIRGRKA